MKKYCMLILKRKWNLSLKQKWVKPVLRGRIGECNC